LKKIPQDGNRGLKLGKERLLGGAWGVDVEVQKKYGTLANAYVVAI